MNPTALALVFLGGGAGAVCRQLFGLAVLRWTALAFPLGTLLINVLGSFVMGVIVEGSALRWNLSPELRLFLTTGVLGGFTTFSAFSLDAALLWSRGKELQAACYVLGSVGLALAAILAGMVLMRRVLG